jgi:uncharacterized membrane protein
MAVTDRPTTAASAAAPLTTAAAPRDGMRKVLVFGTVASAVMAAIYVAFSVAVMPMLGRKNDADFVDAMQRTNVIIENPAFFVAFFAAFVLPALAAWKIRKRGGGPALRWAVASAVLYGIGVVTTMAINVPLNETLASTGDADPSGVRADFEATWNTWNAVRAVLSVAATGAVARALYLHRTPRA